uniref:Guanylate kinase-like domain-containing protein n=1 Tax=Clytia hemisphaerica TaxID=252671 RepID=A0A7M5V0V0_9CNID
MEETSETNDNNENKKSENKDSEYEENEIAEHVEISDDVKDVDDEYEVAEDEQIVKELIEDGLSQVGHSASGTNQVYLNLTLQNKDICDISFLVDYDQIQVLDLSHNRLEDLSMLKCLPFLISLNVSNNQLKKIIDFTPPLRIREMNFSNNKISTIADLSMHASLHTLLLDFNEIEEISGLVNCASLKNLSISNNRISKITGLSKLNLKQLDLSYNDIRRIENLQDLEFIQYLNLSFNNIRSLRGLQEHGYLEEINLHKNQILDLSEIRYLRDLRMLRILNLSENPIKEIESYRISAVFKLSKLVELDEMQVTPEEKVHACNFFQPSKELSATKDHMYNLMKFYQQPQRLMDSSLPILEPYPMLIITGPLGLSKKQLVKQLSTEFSNFFSKVKGHTTAAVNTEEFYHVTEDEFETMRFKGEFLQTCTVCGVYHGISRSEIENVAKTGLAAVLTTTIDGVMGFKCTHYEPRVILVLPKDIEDFKQELYDSNRYNETEIDAALKNVNFCTNLHMERPGYFDTVITTDSYEERYGNLKETVLDFLGLNSSSSRKSCSFSRTPSLTKSIRSRLNNDNGGTDVFASSPVNISRAGNRSSLWSSHEHFIPSNTPNTPADFAYSRRFEATRSVLSRAFMFQ